MTGCLPTPGGLLASAGHGHFDFAAWSVGEWILFGSAGLITAWVLWLAVRSTVSPGEEALDHVKRSILDDDPPSPAYRPPTRRAAASTIPPSSDSPSAIAP